MISAGELDRSIAVQRATVVYNDFNEPVETWEDLVTVRARRRDVSDGEKFAAGQIGASIMARFVIRSSTETRAIIPSDRLIHEDDTWSIQGIKEMNEGRFRFLEITAARDAD